jgi:hypothetical protein
MSAESIWDTDRRDAAAVKVVNDRELLVIAAPGDQDMPVDESQFVESTA